MDSRFNRGGERVDIPPNLVVAAHELKSPLVLIRQLGLSLEDSTDRREAARRIILTSERALRLTSDITRHARLEDSVFESEACNAYAIFDDVAREVRPLYDAHNRTIRIARKRHRQAPIVVANRDLLQRTLLSFLDNALHYRSDISEVKLAIEHNKRQETVRFLVRDFGPRISSHLKQQLASGSRSTVEQARPLSSGLGLAIAKEFAEYMNGSIGLVRHHDGTTFYLELPESHQMSLL